MKKFWFLKGLVWLLTSKNGKWIVAIAGMILGLTASLFVTFTAFGVIYGGWAWWLLAIAAICYLTIVAVLVAIIYDKPKTKIIAWAKQKLLERKRHEFRVKTTAALLRIALYYNTGCVDLLPKDLLAFAKRTADIAEDILTQVIESAEEVKSLASKLRQDILAAQAEGAVRMSVPEQDLVIWSSAGSRKLVVRTPDNLYP